MISLSVEQLDMSRGLVKQGEQCLCCVMVSVNISLHSLTINSTNVNKFSTKFYTGQRRTENGTELEMYLSGQWTPHARCPYVTLQRSEMSPGRSAGTVSR